MKADQINFLTLQRLPARLTVAEMADWVISKLLNAFKERQIEATPAQIAEQTLVGFQMKRRITWNARNDPIVGPGLKKTKK